jgi:ABC-2 type transport system ATP-binding protein
MGYFDQMRPLYPSLRVEETLRLGKKLNEHWDGDAAVRWLTDVDIALDERVGRLSIGQQALVALALCMGKRPDLLLLDEPLASLDPLARRRLLETLLGTVAEQGTTVFLSSHIISELEPVCDHLVILSSSNVRISGSIETLLAEHHVLIGPRSDTPPPGPDVVLARAAERQTTLLVRGALPDLGPNWQRLQPDLDEIVLAYLEDQPERTASANRVNASTEGNAS